MMVQDTYSLWKTESKIIYSNDDEEDCDRNQILRKIAAELIESKFVPEKIIPRLPEQYSPLPSDDECTLTDTVKNKLKRKLARNCLV